MRGDSRRQVTSRGRTAGGTVRLRRGHSIYSCASECLADVSRLNVDPSRRYPAIRVEVDAAPCEGDGPAGL
jgi:hypothetical protein